ncbi:MAG: hypothetical protein R6V85_05125 [Polyangia bacterium]
MRIAARLALLALPLACSAADSYWMEVKTGKGREYVEVECDPQGNPGGFRLEFPRCYCHGGIEVSWFADLGEPLGGGPGFVLRRSYLTDETPEIRVVSRDDKQVVLVLVEGADGRLHPLDRREDAAEWERNLEHFSGIMGEFGGKLYEVEMYCRAKRSGEERKKGVR